MDRSFRIALGSLGVALAVLAFKVLAYLVTGSVALYSDALESIINVVTALGVIVAIRIAARPPDRSHPYGHQKAEYLSAVVVGVMIVVAAVAILREAYAGLLAPPPIEMPGPGLAASAIATTLNFAWSRLLIAQGRRDRSAAMVADGTHLMADVVTSAGVLAGVVLVVVTGIRILDPLLASLVALHVMWSGWTVIRDSADGLMDMSAPPEELERIRATIAAHSAGSIQVHDLRTRRAGRATFIQFHLVVPAEMSVGAAHAICDRIEAALHRAVPGAVPTIHVEPPDKAKPPGMRAF